MARCFPFPPPGYVLNGIRDEALIVSIKGAEEKAKKEQSRKEGKRDKKEKKDRKDKKDKKEKKDKDKKEKKDKDKKDKKEKKRKEREGESEKHSHKRRCKEDAKDGPTLKVDLFRKLKISEIDCLEKSSLTVERELFQSTSQNSCDSTLNSNEILQKQKEKQPLDSRHNNNDSESIIRIKLPIRRQKDPEVIMINKDQEKPCPSRGIDSSQLATNKEPVSQHPCSTSAPEHTSKSRIERRKDHISTAKLGKEKLSSSSTAETYQPSSLCRICPPSMAVQFLNLVEKWVPDTIERRVDLANSEDGECWWFMKKPSSYKFDTERCKQLNIDNEIKQVSNSMAWPCARLLPEADVYALPYTVPF